MKQTPQYANGSGDDLSPETLAAMQELGLVLKSIYLRMRKDGWRMIDGKLIKPH